MGARGLMSWPTKLSRAPGGVRRVCCRARWLLGSIKSAGNIFLADATGRLNRITPKITGAFYHEVEWHDFNGNGLKDILTVRVNQIGFVPGSNDEGKCCG